MEDVFKGSSQRLGWRVIVKRRLKEMDEKLAEAILIQLAQINANISGLNEQITGFVVDLSEFSDRFEEVVTEMENERRIDRLTEYN